MLGLTRDNRRAAQGQKLPPGAQRPLGTGLWLTGRLPDSALFGFAAALGGLAFGYLWHSHGEVLDALDLAFGIVACLALWWRRDYPVAVTLVAFGAGSFPRWPWAPRLLPSARPHPAREAVFSFWSRCLPCWSA
jgi:hypothetical protein